MANKEKVNKKELNSNRSKEAILDAACTLFSLKGFEGTTSKALATLAGCSEGLIFKYFKDKQHLLNQLLIEWVEKCIIEFNSLPETNSLKEELYGIIKLFFVTYSTQRNLSKMLIVQKFSSDSQFATELRNSYLEARNSILKNRFKKYLLNKELRQDVDIIETIDMIQGYSLLEVIFREISETEYMQKVDSLLNVCLMGVQATM